MAYNYSEIVPYLLDWFENNARILAWREDPKPYYVWVSEIMLQQTRVEAVKGYFDRFTRALPDIKALADAEEEKLLKLWEGLGYYSRVRNLQKAAKQVIEENNGELPADYDKLLKLPGIGSYTAGAIASIAFHVPVPAIDGNVLRVTKRISGSLDDITKDEVKRELWRELLCILPKSRPGDFNQALMELGATVCLPNGKPLCDKCPLMHLCKALHEGTIHRIPVKPAKKERRLENRTILVIEYKGSFAVRKRAAKGLLAGLWELPGLEGRQDQEELPAILHSMGFSEFCINPLGAARHIFSHVEWHMTGFHIILGSAAPPVLSGSEGLRWASREEIEEKYSIPNAFSAYLEVIKKGNN